MPVNSETAADIVGGDVESIAARTGAELDALAGRDVLLTGGGGFLGYMFVHLLAGVGERDGRAPIKLTIYENFSRGRKAIAGVPQRERQRA